MLLSDEWLNPYLPQHRTLGFCVFQNGYVTRKSLYAVREVLRSITHLDQRSLASNLDLGGALRCATFFCLRLLRSIALPGTYGRGTAICIRFE